MVRRFRQWWRFRRVLARLLRDGYPVKSQQRYEELRAQARAQVRR